MYICVYMYIYINNIYIYIAESSGSAGSTPHWFHMMNTRANEWHQDSEGEESECIRHTFCLFSHTMASRKLKGVEIPRPRTR